MSEAVAEGNIKCYEIDCSALVKDNLLSVEDMKNYLESRIKVDGRCGNLEGNIEVLCTEESLMVNTKIHISKKYLKYLGKRFLHKKELKDWVRLVSSGKNSYRLAYYKVNKSTKEEE